MPAVAAAALFAFALICGQGCQQGPPPPPRDYHFNSAGNDRAGDGSAANPYRSVGKANDLQLNPGDRLLFAGGQSFPGNLTLTDEDAGTPAQPVTVGSYGTGRATIVADDGTGVKVENCGGVRVADLVVVGVGPRANYGSGVEFVNTLNGGVTLSFVRVENVEARGFGREGVHVHGAPPDRGPSGFSDVAVVGCVARGNRMSGVYVSGHTGGEWGEEPTKYAHRDVRVVRCVAEGNTGEAGGPRENRAGSGILLDAVDGGLVDQCEATNNGAANRARDGGPVGIWCTVSKAVVIQRCKSHRNRTGGTHDGGGFCLDGGTRDCVLQHNVSERNDGSGFGLYEYDGAPPAVGNVVRHNVSRDDGRRNGYAGIHVWDAELRMWDARVHDNVVTMSAAGEARSAAGWSVYRQPARGLWVQSPVRDVEVSGNVLEVAAGDRLVDVAWGPSRLRLANNVYRVAGGGDTVALAWHGREFASLAEWLRATGEPQAAAEVPTAARADAKD